MYTDIKKETSTSDERIDEACENFKMVKNSNNDKFLSLDLWLKKESKIYLKEITYVPKIFMIYKKGTIIKVDFGINIGGELSHSHFAIVMDNNDNAFKETLSVIPLTSKRGSDRVYLGTLILDEFIKQMQNEIKILKNSTNSKEDIQELKDLIVRYNKYRKLSFANVSQFRCISKNRIFYPKNKHDPIGKVTISNELLEKLISKLQILFC